MDSWLTRWWPPRLWATLDRALVCARDLAEENGRLTRELEARQRQCNAQEQVIRDHLEHTSDLNAKLAADERLIRRLITLGSIHLSEHYDRLPESPE